MMNVLKTVVLFIGTIVGAGLATGRELTVYFYGYSPLTASLSGIIIGLLMALFLFVGRSETFLRSRNGFMGKIIDSIMTLTMFASYIIMVSGGEELLFEIFGVKYLGLLTGIAVAIVSSFTMNSIKKINLVIVPALLAMIFYLGAGEKINVVGNIGIAQSCTYAGMNMLLGGYIIMDEGSRMKKREIVASAVTVGVIFAILLFLMTGVIADFSFASMPIYALATKKGVGIVAGLIIYLAILSTLIGTGKVVYNKVLDVAKYSYVPIFILAITSALSFNADFSTLVKYVYPVEGFIGVAYIAYIISFFVYISVFGKEKKNCRLKIRREENCCRNITF